MCDTDTPTNCVPYHPVYHHHPGYHLQVPPLFLTYVGSIALCTSVLPLDFALIDGFCLPPVLTCHFPDDVPDIAPDEGLSALPQGHGLTMHGEEACLAEDAVVNELWNRRLDGGCLVLCSPVRRFRALFGIVVVVGCCIPAGALAQGIYIPSAGPVSRSMGGATTAVPIEGIGALYWNPAVISALPSSELGFGADLLSAVMESAPLRVRAPERRKAHQAGR